LVLITFNIVKNLLDDEMINNEEFIKILKETGWRKRWLASLLGVHPSLISKWLSDERDAGKYMDRIREIFDLYKRGKIKDTKMGTKYEKKAIGIKKDIHKKMKILCAKEEIPIGEYVNRVIEAAVNSGFVPKNGGKIKFQIVS